VAALNHPHICALHDVSRAGGTPFLVMEYVAGETLAAHLANGPVPVRDLIRYSIQIAEALDHAHRHGVIHRDLKPANIMLTKSGVKVLDFGLATLRSAGPVPMPLDATPAVHHRLTSERTLLGTVYYMAPERLEGREADARSDLFSLGVVMYEMATGRRPFESGSPAGVIAALLRSEPSAPSTIRPDLPHGLDWVIQKSLAGNPDSRWQAAGDVVEILRWLLRTGGGSPDQAPRRPLGVPIAGAVVALAALLLAASTAWLRSTDAPAPRIASSILPPSGGGFTPTPSSVPTPQFALSPDGRRLTFVASLEHGTPQLWVRRLDSLTPQVVPGTQGAEYPFWSPDSQSIGFFANGSLRRVDLAGGPARALAPAAHGRGGTWSRSGVILFSPDTQSGLYRVPAAGGEARPVTALDPAHREASHRFPQFLPDDRQFIYFAQGTSSEAHGICLGSLDGSAPQRLVNSGLSAAFAPPGHVLFVADDALMAQAFDPAARRLEGEPFPVVLSVAGSSNFYAAFSVSETGLLVYASSAASADLVWMDRAGTRLGSVGATGEYVDFRLSPDDRQLAVAEVDPDSDRPDLRVLDLARGARLRLTHDSATDASPVWSPDGRRIVFRSNRSGLHDIYERAANGAGPHALLLQSPDAKYPTDWTPDGRGIVFHTYSKETGSDIRVLSSGGSSSIALVQTRFDEMQGQLSKDGKWLAYTSLESGEAEVYIRSVTDPSQRWQVSSGGGWDPRWRDDTRELFSISADGFLSVVGFAGAPSAARKLFAVRTLPPRDPYLSSYDVTADGQRFLVKVPVRDVTSTPLHVLTGWLSARAGR
jgi:serine/threonine protein kinase